MGFLGVLVIIRPGLDTFDFFAAFTLPGYRNGDPGLGTRIMPAGSTPILGFGGRGNRADRDRHDLIGGAVIMPTREAWLFLSA